MSKGSKRRSAKQIARDFQHVAPPAPTKTLVYGCEEPPRLIYPRDHRRAQHAAEKERLRDLVRAELAKEAAELAKEAAE